LIIKPGTYVGCAIEYDDLSGADHRRLRFGTFDVLRWISQGLSPVRALSPANVDHGVEVPQGPDAIAVVQIVPATNAVVSAQATIDR
jgi:hypothetical protein